MLKGNAAIQSARGTQKFSRSASSVTSQSFKYGMVIQSTLQVDLIIKTGT